MKFREVIYVTKRSQERGKEAKADEQLCAMNSAAGEIRAPANPGVHFNVGTSINLREIAWKLGLGGSSSMSDDNV